MMQMLYEYITVYKTKQPATCYDEDMNSTVNTWLTGEERLVSELTRADSFYGVLFCMEHSELHVC